MTDSPFSERMRLTDGEKATGLWARLKRETEAELESLRKRNDSPQDERATAELRGKISFAKTIIGLGDDPPLTG